MFIRTRRFVFPRTMGAPGRLGKPMRPMTSFAARTCGGSGIPTYHFQIVVGIYVVQIGFILTVLVNGIENGADKLGERYELGKSMINGTLLYCFLAAVVMILFNLFAGSIVANSLGG